MRNFLHILFVLVLTFLSPLFLTIYAIYALCYIAMFGVSRWEMKMEKERERRRKRK